MAQSTVSTISVSTLESFYLDLISQVGSQAYQFYQRKLLQMLESYSYEIHDRGVFIDYLTDKQNSCFHGNQPGSIYLLKSQRKDASTTNELVIEHEACGEVAITEHLRIEGDGKYNLSPLGVITGLRPYSAPEGQKSLFFETYSKFGEVYFSFIEENNPAFRRFIFQLKDSRILEIFYDKVKGSIFVESHGLTATWLFGNST